MPLVLSRAALCALVLTLVATAPCRADDVLPESQKDPTIEPCMDVGPKLAGCKDGSFAQLVKAIDAAFKAARAKAQPAAAVLFTRDQVWFSEIIENNAQNLSDEKTQPSDIGPALQGRLALLTDIANGFGRTGLAGQWSNAFGSAVLMPAGDGAFRITLASIAIYGADAEQQISCKASALLRAGTDGWLVGDADPSPTIARSVGGKVPRIKARLQGQSLRIVAGNDRDTELPADISCNGPNQLTGSYFAVGKSETAGGAAPFVVPTFDCARPTTAAEEEICADPDLAANDIRLNRLWKSLLPRLDAVTRRWLTEDQRLWLKTQGQHFTNDLHPGRDKMYYFVHQTRSARDGLAQFQRERIGMLEGFDEKRRGFEGDWEAYNARLSVTSDQDGKLHVSGDKWFEDDYKASCEYDFRGKAVGDTFKPEDTGKNPDSIVRDHAVLIVNPTDDEAAKHRFDKDGNSANDAEGKCSRSLSNSSTARLFAVKRTTDKAR